MKIIKNILKWLGMLMVGLLLAAIILPFVFKDKIIEGLKEELNRSVNAEVNFKDVSISFLSSFPDVEISIDSLSVVGKDSFLNISLLAIDKSDISVSLPSFINDDLPYLINHVSLKKPELNLMFTPDSLKNWDIFIPRDSTRNFLIELDKYDVSNGKLTYTDQRTALKLEIENINHEGKGTFTSDIFDLNTKTTSDKINLSYEGVKYIHEAVGTLDAIINVNFPEQKYSLKENKLVLNYLPILLEGYYKYVEDDIEVDLSFNTASNDFKSFLSIIPYAYTKDFASVETKGTAEIKGNVKGIYTNNSLPAFGIDVKVNNAFFKYPSLPRAVENINASINLAAKQGNYQDLSILVPRFSMTLDNEEIKGNLNIQRAGQNPSVKGNMQGKLNLDVWRESFPIETIDGINGTVNMDFDFDASLDNIKSKNYDKMKFSGSLISDNLFIKLNALPTIQLTNIDVKATPARLTFSSKSINCGRSNLSLNGAIQNPLALISLTDSIIGKIDMKARVIDFNELSPASNSSTTKKEQLESPTTKGQGLSKLKINFTADSILYDNYVVQNAMLSGQYGSDEMYFDNLSFNIDKSDIKLNGKFKNLRAYMANEGRLEATASIRSKVLDLNPFMTSSASTGGAKVLIIPENIKMGITTDIDKLIYTDYTLNNFAGNLAISEGTAALTNVRANTLGGKVSFDGLYSTEDTANPNFSFKFDLIQIKFDEAFQKISTFQKLAPIAKYIEGVFNSTLLMDGKLGNNMMPDFSSLNALGYLETQQGNLSGDNPLSKVGNKLGVSALSKITLEQTRNWFEVVDGMLELKPIDVEFQGIKLTLGGRHGLGKDMDYLVQMQVPRNMLKSNQITSLAEEGLQFFEKQAAQLGIDINQGGDVIFDIRLKGKIANPEISIRPSGINGKSASNAVKDAITDKANTVKDSINTEIKNKTKTVVDSIKSTTNTALDSAKNVIKNKAEDALGTVKSNVEKEITEAIGDTLKQAAQEVLKDVIDPSKSSAIDSIKSQIEQWNPFKKKKKKGGK